MTVQADRPNDLQEGKVSEDIGFIVFSLRNVYLSLVLHVFKTSRGNILALTLTRPFFGPTHALSLRWRIVILLSLRDTWSLEASSTDIPAWQG